MSVSLFLSSLWLGSFRIDRHLGSYGITLFLGGGLCLTNIGLFLSCLLLSGSTATLVGAGTGSPFFLEVALVLQTLTGSP